MNLDDRHVSSFVPPLTVTRASLDRGPEIRAGPIPSRPGKNVATASPSMEFHRRIPGRQFASCIRISWIPSSCIGIPALIAVADRRKNDRIDAQTTPRDYRSLSLCDILCDILNRHDENNLARRIILMSNLRLKIGRCPLDASKILDTNERIFNPVDWWHLVIKKIIFLLILLKNILWVKNLSTYILSI